MALPEKLDRLLFRAEEIRHTLNTADGGQIGALTRELSELDPLVEKVTALRNAERARDEAEALLADPEMRELAEDDARMLEQEWRSWLGENEIEPKAPARHYVKFCQSWHEKRGHP